MIVIYKRNIKIDYIELYNMKRIYRQKRRNLFNNYNNKWWIKLKCLKMIKIVVAVILMQ